MKAKRQYRGGYQVAGQTEFARELRRESTSAENLLWQSLRNRRLLGFKFRRQHQFGDYIGDFFCSEANLVIECDGEIHERNESWHHDQARAAYMISQGLRVLRFSNQRILNDTDSVLREIEMHLPSPSGRGAGGEGLAPRRKPSPQPSPRGRGR
jgi:very-short-patch-repair endonuclease